MLANVAACAACGNENPKRSRFCGACAAPLSPVTGPVREERRVVTVLFCDLAGFTARSEALDPEDVRAFLVPYYDVLAAEITRHGGLVDRFLGDGVMALFGAPVAHEDDPERAVRAALRILERIPSLGVELHVRLGINTGEVLYAAGSSGERDDSVTGDAVNTAARLQAAAPVDAVVVGEATYRATARLFRYEELTPVSAKGKAEPVPLWRPLGPIARRAGELHPETTPFVGRDIELALLVALFERARATPSLEVATILAEPGLGKSRLVRELARHLEALPDLVTWRVGRCLPYGDGAGLWALGEIVKAHAGILEGDGQAAVSAKFDAVLTEPDPSLRAWMKDRLGPLVGLQTGSAPPQQEEAFTAWRQFLESITRGRPTVLVIEDLHWADDTLVAFLSHVADHVAGLPLLLVTTARPELEERHPAWLSRTRRSSVISLAALPEPSMAQLVTELIPRSSPEMTATILERASGSPLYAEQLAAILRDGPAMHPTDEPDEAVIPPSIAALLAARIDALPDAEKVVLLDASVIGRTFWPGAVAAVGGHERADVEGHLAELARRELVRPTRPSSMNNEAEFRFWHALLRDVAYGRLTRRARLAKHRAAAAWITGRYGGTLGEAGEIVVAHLDRALELARATGAAAELGRIRDALVGALLDAADTAIQTDLPRALTHIRRAVGMMEPDDARRPAAMRSLGHALSASSDYPQAVAAFESAAAMLRARGDPVSAAELGAPLAVALGSEGDFQRGVAVLTESRAVLERHPGPGLAAILAEQAALRVFGEHADAPELAAKAIELASSFGLPPPHRALMVRGITGLPLGHAGAEADLRGAIDGAVRAGDLRAASITFYNLATMSGDIGGPAAGIRLFDEAIAFCGAHGVPTELARSGRAEHLMNAGEWDELLREADHVAAWARRHGDVMSEVVVRLAATHVRLERGESIGPQDALAAMTRDVGYLPTWAAPIIAEAAMRERDVGAARAVLAEALEATADGEFRNDACFVRACLRAGALDLARQALGIAAVPSARDLDRPIAMAIVAEAVGDLAAAKAGYETLAPRLARFGYVPEHAYALAGLGRCLLALGETEEGIARLREARAIWERLKATPRIAEIDALLAAAPTA
jgi:class 3 adenylate cyclase/tetratricopeptide (TPR) repeat protein